jgi:DNA-binding HxlR family transcriptional regulator
MKTFLHEGICPIRDILSRLGDKWSLLVLTTLYSNGTMRFNDIQRSLGDISQRMLTVTLRSLEADGLVHREVYPEVPPRVEYRLTDSGGDLMPYLNSLVEGVEEHAGHFGTACAGGAGEVICRRYKTSVCSGLGCRAANTCLSVGEAFPTSCLRNPCGISPSGVPASRWSVPDRP